LRVTDTLAQIVALDTARLGVVVTPARVSIRVWLAPSPASQAAADSLPP
jgi:hypothetical protein